MKLFKKSEGLICQPCRNQLPRNSRVRYENWPDSRRWLTYITHLFDLSAKMRTIDMV